MTASKLTWLVVGVICLAIFLVIVTDASAARPSQRVAERQAAWAVDQLCGPVCMERINPTVFYRCGTQSKCWKTCFTHRERKFWSWRVVSKCSSGKMSRSHGYLNYYFEY